MKAMVIKAGKFPVIKNIEKTLEAYYEEIGCDCIDIVSRKINGSWFDIICDDEGLFKDPLVVTAVDPNGSPALVGTLLICRFDGVDDVTDLEPGDADTISEAIALTVQNDELQPVVIVEYE